MPSCPQAVERRNADIKANRASLIDHASGTDDQLALSTIRRFSSALCALSTGCLSLRMQSEKCVTSSMYRFGTAIRSVDTLAGLSFLAFVTVMVSVSFGTVKSGAEMTPSEQTTSRIRERTGMT